MQVNLTELKPKLEETTKETIKMMEIAEKESIEAEKKSAVVAEEEKVATAQSEQAQALKDECENDLAEAIPALEEAMRALDTLKVNR